MKKGLIAFLLIIIAGGSFSNSSAAIIITHPSYKGTALTGDDAIAALLLKPFFAHPGPGAKGPG